MKAGDLFQSYDRELIKWIEGFQNSLKMPYEYLVTKSGFGTATGSRCRIINSLRPIQNSRCFNDDIFKCIFLNVWILIHISLNFVPKVPVNNIPALVQIMGWRRLGDKPLSEPMMVRLPTLICVTRSQWLKLGLHFMEVSLKVDDMYICAHTKPHSTASPQPSHKYILVNQYLSRTFRKLTYGGTFLWIA